MQEIRTSAGPPDERRTRFGIRTISLDADKGLRINGQPVLLRGGNIHHDNYMIGAAGVPDADARKVALMKAAGYNAIRNAHNPASQATLDAADELGMLVIDEAFDSWNKSKNAAGLFALLRRRLAAGHRQHGRQRPQSSQRAVLEHRQRDPRRRHAPGCRDRRKLAERVRMLDPTRPVTQASTPTRRRARTRPRCSVSSATIITPTSSTRSMSNSPS